MSPPTFDSYGDKHLICEHTSHFELYFDNSVWEHTPVDGESRTLLLLQSVIACVL